jgi:DNA-binding SARP family transcriptional activator
VPLPLRIYGTAKSTPCSFLSIRRAALPTLTLLGSITLTDDDDVVVTGRAVQRHCLALLALLAGERRGMSRDSIVAILWPDSDSATARHRLSVALHVLRQRLGHTNIRSAGDALALDPASWRVDVWIFEDTVAAGDFTAAEAACRGSFLPGFYLRGVNGFEHWLDRRRARLDRGSTAVLEALAEEAERNGDTRNRVRWRQELNRREPCSGARTVALMRALSEAGNRDDAIRCARSYALAVREELDLDPDPAVTLWAEKIAAGGASSG